MNSLVVFSTVPSSKEAARIAKLLVQNHLAACVNVIPGLRSYFWWNGKIDRCREVLLVMKTRKQKFKLLEKWLKKNHPYQVPEIIALPIERGNRKYLAWIGQALAGL
ncbi:MAG TPA: divalent-cation tolerance protein CutA [Candidatus Omnitrophota bacterium]|nr:divalent-cation tolerance protein CutA [Candidatus Omnitrophota bacterium]